ncbi:hypothetical protein [Natronolimnohabitans innermongolicus]|uniref:Uncharacterized protein n=1 Tax=Natronolimnohabitans innermongolicus JCM 12255 TaxID=1227499 RepID=L9X8I3_9EURY|nr:hypothetical protein [Natronolimnohabitans innermongolicus]ELY57761.1 hypothetical protein C493_07724 [Natronolimnohabitans innermongolicus JCM 12255]
MGHRRRVPGTRRQRLSRRLADLEGRLEDAEQQLEQVENTLRGVLREANDVSLGGPCKCGESLLIVRRRTIYCPRCRYRRAI